jgi:hypothetical protein
MVPEKEYSLSNAVDLFSQQAAIVINLWTVYVVATFAAAGFALSSDGPLNIFIVIAVTVGFWLFAMGHLQLLKQSLLIMQDLEHDIKLVLKNLEGDSSFYFKLSIKKLIEAANPPRISIRIHYAIDLCATAALWIGSRFWNTFPF